MATDNYPTIRVTKTELVWPSKFDAQGKVRPVEKAILPFQAVETVNESKTDREDSLLFRQRGEEPKTWRNKLIWGDNKVVMASLLPEFEGKIDLIYIDPPFATGQDFSFQTQVGDQEVTKEPSIIEEKAYRDTWGRDKESWFGMIRPRLILMRDLLSEHGTLYVHMDWYVGHHLRPLLDEVFGESNSLGEVIWAYGSPSGGRVAGSKLVKAHDMIFVYARRYGEHRYRMVYLPYSEKYVQDWFKYEDDSGRKYRKRWRRHKDGRSYFEKQYLDESPGVPASTVWSDIQQVYADPRAYKSGMSSDITGFPTQKPEKLLNRILEISSNPGDLVADFFCGSGTMGSVAEKLGRRWIMCDLSKWAIQVSRKRLLGIKDCRPFEILNLGNYQRHKLAANGCAGPVRYLKFILDLYRAEVQTGHRMLHGKKGGALVHVGAVDSPITLREIRETLAEAKEAGAREVHFLGWDFEMGLHDLVEDVGNDYGLKVRLVSIPRESLEVADPAKEHLRFYDLNYLDVEAEAKKRTVTVRIKDFAIANPEYLPEEVRERVKKFSDYIDYWAVDWDYKGDTFHNGWQDFRTRKKRALKTDANHEYEESGTYRVLVKVVDVFGNDTTKLLQVKVK